MSKFRKGDVVSILAVCVEGSTEFSKDATFVAKYPQVNGSLQFSVGDNAITLISRKINVGDTVVSKVTLRQYDVIGVYLDQLWLHSQYNGFSTLNTTDVQIVTQT